MPVLSSFISYRPGRTKAKAKSPFAVRQFDSPASPHPYASSSSHILDINDGGVLAPNRGPVDGSSRDRYREHYTNGSNASPSPHVELSLGIDREPLADWFPTSLLKSDPFTMPLDREFMEAGGSGVQHQYGRDTIGNSRMNEVSGSQESSSVDEEDDERGGGSAEDVVANLETMNALTFMNHPGAEEPSGYSSLTYLKKAAPSPIQIPNPALHGPKVQLVRSADPSRPTSQVSSAESSAISGTTLARALMNNTFALSGDSRTSRYRSGTSSLTRSDSATLPRGEFAMLHSPYWRDRTHSGGEMSLSPRSAPSEPVPPVPVNAELVYVPPKTVRQGSDSHEKRRHSSTGSLRSEGLSDPATSATTQPDSANLNKAPHRISRITEDTSPPPKTPQLPAADLKIQNTEGTRQILSSEAGPSRALSTKRESETYSEGIMSPGHSSFVSETPSSAKDIDNVLDYYSFPDTPDLGQDRNFRPAFSPISEESTSQLSPPTPFRGDLKRVANSGRFFAGPIVSPASPNGRMEFGPSRRISETRAPMGARPSKQPLLPIGERPRSQISVAPAPAPSTPRHNPLASTSYSPGASDNNGNLLAPPASKIFNRERSGSAPSPIKVIRDPHDYKSYNITVTPRPDSFIGSTPTTGDSDLIQQDFPETPNAFSPLFSASAVPSPGIHRGHGSEFMSMAVPQTPMSAFLPTTAIQPSIAQRALLTRAATSVRHSRQASLNRARATAHPYARPTSIHDNSQEGADITSNEPLAVNSGALNDQSDANKHSTPPPPTIIAQPPSDAAEGAVLAKGTSSDSVGSSETTVAPQPPPSPSIQKAPTPEPASSIHSKNLSPEPPSARSFSSNGSGPNSDIMSMYSGMATSHSQPHSVTHSRPTSRADSANFPSDACAESPNARSKIQQRIPPSPKRPPPAPPQHSSSNMEDPSPLPPSDNSHIRHQLDVTGPYQSNDIQAPTSALTRSASTSSQPSSVGLPVIVPPPPPIQLSSTPSLYSLYDIAPSGSLGSPPPYSSVAATGNATGEALTPTTGGSYDPHYRFGVPHHPHSPNINARDLGNNRQPSNISSRPRGRPPLPAGPRRPSQQHGPLMEMRERGGSFSSLASNLPVGSGRRLNPAALPSPKFQTPSPKWRGYTMDAAKWTFTSSQLQAIVSRAIRQSSEASSIRLLPLDTLDDKIPEELENLETKRTDVKTKYRALTRRRGNLLEALTVQADGLDQSNPGHILRLVDDLKDVSASLDRLAEELHSIDEQIGQLSQLCQAHSASALAMALRKLNASFLKQFAEAQSLRQQMHSLEAERDEAWKHAEEVANEFEDLRTGKMDLSSGSVENRYSRVSAVRKSSLRASRAGLRSGGNRLSQRSSVSSNNRAGANQPSSARTTFYLEEIPPVPPIPRRRPVDIVTDIPLNSVGASTSGPTPTSETRAMVRAQEELYDMLGISINDHRSRRSRSVIALPSDPDHTQHPNSPTPHPHHDVLNMGRRASLPGSPAPQQNQRDALAANVSIMLTADREGWI